MAAPQTVLIIGANRGIGFELATRFLAKGHTVWGTYRPQTRNDESVKSLQFIGAQTLEVDFTDEASISDAARHLDDLGVSLNTLINCAGVYQMWDDKPYTDLTHEDLMGHFKVNVVGPFVASKVFLPALRRAAAPRRIINVSSDMASISDNDGGNVPYRISKAALNQLTKTTAMDLARSGSNIGVLAVHPGFVATKLTGFYGEDDMETCMAALADTIDRFWTDRGNDLANGGYVRYDGEKMQY